MSLWQPLLKQYCVYWRTVKYIGSEQKYPAPRGFRKWWSVSFFQQLSETLRSPPKKEMTKWLTFEIGHDACLSWEKSAERSGREKVSINTENDTREGEKKPGLEISLDYTEKKKDFF